MVWLVIHDPFQSKQLITSNLLFQQRTPLYDACSENCIDVIEILLAQPNIDVDKTAIDNVNYFISQFCSFSFFLVKFPSLLEMRSVRRIELKFKMK